MRYVTLPHHRDPMNVDTIVGVRMDKGGWKYYSYDGPPGRWEVVKRGWFWKPYLWRYHGGYYYQKPRITISLTGDDYRYLECKPGEVERFYEDIQKALWDLNHTGPERIVAAAIGRRERNRAWQPGEDPLGYTVWMTYTQPAPARHHHILHSMPMDEAVVGPHEQGFLTSTGRFVTRMEAMGIAVAAGQVKASKVTAPHLFSEDLW